MENEYPEITPESEPAAASEAFDWLPDRLERARTGAVRELLDEIGLEDVEQLKSYLEDSRDRLERLSKAEESLHRARIDTAFREACRDYPFHDIEEVRALADFSGVEVDESGTVTGMAGAVEALVAVRPYLVKRPVPPSLDVGDLSEGAEAPLSPQITERVRKRFRL